MTQPEQDKTKRIASLSRSLRLKIRLSMLALTVEHLARSFWISAVLALTIVGLLLWQAHSLLPYPFDLGFYGVLVGVFLIFVVRGVRNFKFAHHVQGIARLDMAAKENPITTLVDRVFIGADDDASMELWDLHQKRMADRADRVEVAPPHVRLAKRDPWAVRLIVLLFVCSAVFFGRPNSDQSLAVTLQDLVSGTDSANISLEAWAEPPAYTGLPSIYLNALKDGTPLELVEGTELILRSYGQSELDIITDIVDLDKEGKKLAGERVLLVQKSGVLTIKSGFRTVANWDVTMISDAPPKVALTGEISRTIQGSVQIPYTASDDFGVTGGSVEIALDLDKVDRRFGLLAEPENIEPIWFDLAVPFNADTRDFKETLVENLAKHPWSGLPVIITVSVEDAAGNTSVTEPVYTAMPGKRFFDTLAGALAEQRRDILWNRDNIDRASTILKTLTHLPEEGFPNQRAYLMVRSVIRRVGYTETRPIEDEMQNDVSETLWRAALLIEGGDLANAAERLKRAQERLSEAMKNGATDDEIAELMYELRKATDEYLRELAQNAQPQDEKVDNQNRQEISPDMLQEMMDRIQELMEQGRMDEAQALMEQLQQLMENMQVTQGDPQQGEGQEGMESLQDTLRQQQELADENFQEMQEEFDRNEESRNQDGEDREGENQQGENEGNQQTPGGGDQGDLADRQEALRDLMEKQLGELNEDNSEAGRAARDALEQAEREMGNARDNLAEGRGAEALDNQADAVEALRNGMRDLNEANQQANQGQSREGQQNSRTDGEDPLGRSTSKDGTAQTNERYLNSSENLQRSKEILEEIRRRSGERTRPQLELDYLDRLLDRF